MMHKKYKKGFTLTELVVVVSILSILTLLISVIIVRSIETYRFNRESASYQEQAMKAMLDFEKNVRGAIEVVAADADSFIFFVYLPKDDYPAPSKVRYFFEDNQIKRGEIKPEGIGPVFEYIEANEKVATVTYNVTAPSIFTYYNDLSAELEQPVPTDAVRMVKLTLSVDKNLDVVPAAITESTNISLRNLKTNL